MKKSLIFLSVFIIAFIAFFDVKNRLGELDKAAANTPSQVEMKQMINKPDEQMKNHIPDFKNTVRQNSQTLREQMNEPDKYMQNQLENIDKRRGTIDKQ